MNVQKFDHSLPRNKEYVHSGEYFNSFVVAPHIAFQDQFTAKLSIKLKKMVGKFYYEVQDEVCIIFLSLSPELCRYSLECLQRHCM